MVHPVRTPLISLGALLLIYSVLYVLLTVGGEYQRSSSLSLTYVWQPAGIDAREGRTNWLGTVYMPLVALDRTLWHRDRDFVEMQRERLEEALPGNDG